MNANIGTARRSAVSTTLANSEEKADNGYKDAHNRYWNQRHSSDQLHGNSHHEEAADESDYYTGLTPRQGCHSARDYPFQRRKYRNENRCLREELCGHLRDRLSISCHYGIERSDDVLRSFSNMSMSSAVVTGPTGAISCAFISTI
jgi:hypothetical protein